MNKPVTKHKANGDFFPIAKSVKKYKARSNKSELNIIFNEDCKTGLHKLKKRLVNLIVTDPPFAINFQKVGSQYNRKDANVLKGYNEIKQEEYFDFTCEWLKECTRVLSDNGSIFLVSGWTNLRDILNAVEVLGLQQ